MQPRVCFYQCCVVLRPARPVSARASLLEMICLTGAGWLADAHAHSIQNHQLEGPEGWCAGRRPLSLTSINTAHPPAVIKDDNNTTFYFIYIFLFLSFFSSSSSSSSSSHISPSSLVCPTALFSLQQHPKRSNEYIQLAARRWLWRC